MASVSRLSLEMPPGYDDSFAIGIALIKFIGRDPAAVQTLNDEVIKFLSDNGIDKLIGDFLLLTKEQLYGLKYKKDHAPWVANPRHSKGGAWAACPDCDACAAGAQIEPHLANRLYCFQQFFHWASTINGKMIDVSTVDISLYNEFNMTTRNYATKPFGMDGLSHS